MYVVLCTVRSVLEQDKAILHLQWMRAENRSDRPLRPGDVIRLFLLIVNTDEAYWPVKGKDLSWL